MTGYRSTRRGAGGRSQGWARNALAAGVAIACLGIADAKPQDQGNLGLGLRELMEFQARHAQAAPAQLRAELSRAPSRASLAVLDAQGRVRVNVHLDGKVPLASLQAAARRLGAESVAADARYRHGVFSAYLPIGKARELARLAGVKSVLLSPAPVADVGLVTSQGAATVHADQVNALGIRGAGVTVGVLSDSYDTASKPITNAKKDVANGDLPGRRNPDGYTAPVVVLEDSSDGTDEGRAMMQIVHDLAPAAKLCFATAFNGEVSFAHNIRRLAAKGGPCKADVVVDDVIYFTEPMFSDGIIAQAADYVVSKGVPYFSSAGNRGSTMGYLAGFNKVDDAVARDSGQTVDLSQIAAGSSDGGFHNLATDGTIDVARTITFGATSTLVLQWNDPFDTGGVTTDYDLYLFNDAGDQLVATSNDDNFATDEPVEAVQVPAGTYQIVVARSDKSTDQPVADQVRFVTFGSVLNGEYLNYTTPITFGHNSAAGTNGTAAFAWFEDYVPESYTSPGPAIIYLDGAGNRLATPEIRRKPDIGAPDGVNTSFFSGDTAEDADTFPNFFGTSAAAPHAAAVAALVIEKAGGPGSISPSQLGFVLKKTARAHDTKPNFASAQGAFGAGTVHVSATGDGQSRSQFDPNVFRIGLNAPDGYTLKSVTLDLSTANAQRHLLGNPAPGIQFDPRTGGPGQPLVLGMLKNIAAGDIAFSPVSDVPPFSQQLTVSFSPGAFGRKSVVHFGVDRDETSIGAGGNSADLLVGGKISGVVTGPTGDIPFTGTFGQVLHKGYSTLEGLGLIDALAAVQSLP
jgi:Subtilase family